MKAEVKKAVLEVGSSILYGFLILVYGIVVGVPSWFFREGKRGS